MKFIIAITDTLGKFVCLSRAACFGLNV